MLQYVQNIFSSLAEVIICGDERNRIYNREELDGIRVSYRVGGSNVTLTIPVMVKCWDDVPTVKTRCFKTGSLGGF